MIAPDPDAELDESPYRFTETTCATIQSLSASEYGAAVNVLKLILQVLWLTTAADDPRQLFDSIMKVFDFALMKILQPVMGEPFSIGIDQATMIQLA